MTLLTVLLLESDPTARAKLADYLRDCGYRVVETVNTDEAAKYLASDGALDFALIDAAAPGAISAFAIAADIRRMRSRADVVLVGSIAAAAQSAAEMCDNGPGLKRPYDPSAVVDLIRQGRARRQRDH